MFKIRNGFINIFVFILSFSCCHTLQARQNQDIENIVSAWKGHRAFAEWLVQTMKPEQVVDLGVDWGYSTFVFAKAVKKNGKGIVTGIDLFLGDPQTSFRNTYEQVMSWRQALSLTHYLNIIIGDFREVSLTWNRPIDILHIDGYHTYEAVRGDFFSWEQFVKESGIILFHDINVPRDDFEVINFFRELEGGHKLYFLHSFGLGIYTKNDALYRLIKSSFPNVCDFEVNPI